ncbi:hypothetical protein DEAC_c14530 [Desulfosporosinus acididurans]|uniref:Uncharacterized protein n=1 Tax=Desulfosporosinus acididurans TaxID=476652 RepID=A0A0J1FTI3_9FIRM|nr:hypothetical protein [Desulfosporosinus acididurans]KLU66785.1 hypothetical protein DEAC_c14530 [Desulfosporosinus acididurans]
MEIDMDEMIFYIAKITGIHFILVASVLDAEEMFLQSKGLLEGGR